MSCEKGSQVHAFYDGELPVLMRDDIDSHIRQCGECAALLADLQAMSSMIQNAPMTPMPAATLKRVQQAWWARQDRGVLRLAEWMTAAAAAVLVGAMMLWPSGRSENGNRATAATWQVAAVMPPTESREETAEVIELAQWMANDLSDQTGRP